MEQRRILAISDYGHTGIAESLKPQLRHWHDQGHEIWHLGLGFNGWTAAVDVEEYPWRDRLLRMLAHDEHTRFGQSSIDYALNISKADVVITSFDAWMVSYLATPERDPFVVQYEKILKVLDRDQRSFTHIAYFPIDGLLEDKYVPGPVDEFICGFDVPVTYSQFSADGIRRTLGIDVPMIPIAHDPNVFKPGDKAAARKLLNLPQDKFIVGMVATNQYRKRFDEFMAACGKFAADKDDVLVLPWTTWTRCILGGYQIPSLVRHNNLANKVINPGDQVGELNDDGMAALYQALDVCVLTTIGEGAGLPPIRARACGTPALVSNNTSNTEFAAHPFELIPSHISHTDQGSAIARYSTNVGVLAARLQELYERPSLRASLGENGVKAMRKYEIQNIMPSWDALLEAVA